MLQRLGDGDSVKSIERVVQTAEELEETPAISPA